MALNTQSLRELRYISQLTYQLKSIDPALLVDKFEAATNKVFSTAPVDAAPVLLPAYNEQDGLPAALIALSRSKEPVRPLVIDNNSTDETALVAKRMGAIVVPREPRGKFSAIQGGLEYVKEEIPDARIILETDADTIVNQYWCGSMSRKAATLLSLGGVVFGLARVQGGESKPTDTLRTAILTGKQVYAHMSGVTPGARGANMAIALDDNGVLLDTLLSLPSDSFPDDRIVRETVQATGGLVVPNIELGSTVITPGDRYSSLGTYLAALTGIKKASEIYGADVANKVANERAVPI